MDIVGYVARRMLWDVCEIITPLNSIYEDTYDTLFNWMEMYTDRFGGRILHRLPPCKSTEAELLSDMAELYAGVISATDDIDDLRTLHCLFTISFYMMVRYKETPRLCSKISYYFELISYRLTSWDVLTNRYENEI